MTLRARLDRASRIWIPGCAYAMRSAANSGLMSALPTMGNMATRPAMRVRREKQPAILASYSDYDSGIERLADIRRHRKLLQTGWVPQAPNIRLRWRADCAGPKRLQITVNPPSQQ